MRHSPKGCSETTQYILQCTKDLQSIQPGGQGHNSSIRIRLLHAAVRQRIKRLTHKNHSYYDMGKFGVPINDLDCVYHPTRDSELSNISLGWDDRLVQCNIDLGEFPSARHLVKGMFEMSRYPEE